MPRQVIATLLMGAVVMAGCQAPGPATQPAASHPGQTQPLALSADAPVIGFDPVARGVYVAIDRAMPLSNEAAARAKLVRADILTALRAKFELPETTTAPAEVESPPQAVKLYLQGRQRFLQGANAEAMTALEQALAIDPQAFTVLRLMGRVSFAASQLPRGAMYLERAHSLRPRDVEVNYFLGRYYMERGDWEKSAYYLLVAEESPERTMTSTLTPLTAFYLGIALQQGGYHTAAGKQFERFIELAELPIPGYRYDAELNYLLSMKWASQLAAAENEARIGAYKQALPQYEAAAAARPDDRFIGSRLVNALAHEGKGDAARTRAQELLQATKGSGDAVKLLAWTYQRDGKQDRLLPELTAFLKSRGGDEESQVLTLAATHEFLGRHSEAVRTLTSYLNGKPTQIEVIKRLMELARDAPSFGEALEATAHAMKAEPDKAEELLGLFQTAAKSAGGAAWVKRGIPPTSVGDVRLMSVAWQLEATTRIAQEAPRAKIEEAFEASVKALPGNFAARETYITFLLTKERFARATEMADEAMTLDAENPRVWRIKIESEASQQRLARALQLAQEAKQKFSDNVEARMQLAAVYRLRQQNREADAELAAVIKDHPKEEAPHRALVASLLERQTLRDPEATFQRIFDALNQYAAGVPSSRFGQFASAVFYARGNRFEESDTILRAMAVNDPDDLEALSFDAQVRVRMGRPAEAMTMLENALKRKASPEVVRTLAAVYRDQNRAADALALTSRMVAEHPDSEQLVLAHAAELVLQSKRAEALVALAAGLKAMPSSQALALALARQQGQVGEVEAGISTLREFMAKQGETTERLYLLASLYNRVGNDDANVAAMQRILTLMPDHTGANNDLGYFWADSGIHLEQAESMIRKAVENLPGNASFLDSLGWLLYKQGKFAEARVMLERAVMTPGGASAEVVQHLGDTMYRLGQVAEAQERWRVAAQMLPEGQAVSRGDRKTREYLTKTLAEVQAGREPAVTPVAVEATKAAGGGAGGGAGTMPGGNEK